MVLPFGRITIGNAAWQLLMYRDKLIAVDKSRPIQFMEKYCIVDRESQQFHLNVTLKDAINHLITK